LSWVSRKGKETSEIRLSLVSALAELTDHGACNENTKQSYSGVSATFEKLLFNFGDSQGATPGQSALLPHF
jgi:hypothetical protein